MKSSYFPTCILIYKRIFSLKENIEMRTFKFLKSIMMVRTIRKKDFENLNVGGKYLARVHGSMPVKRKI